MEKMRKALLPLALATLISGCQTNEFSNAEENYQASSPDSIAFVQDDATEIQSGKRLAFQTLKNQWIPIPGERFYEHSVFTVMPIDYEYNWKHGEEINGVYVGIEGRIGASIFSPVYMGFEIYNYLPSSLESVLEDDVRDSLQSGYSLVVFESEKWSAGVDEETARIFGLKKMLDAFEQYILENGRELEIDIDQHEINTLRNRLLPK